MMKNISFITAFLFTSLMVNAQYTMSLENIDINTRGITKMRLQHLNDKVLVSIWAKCSYYKKRL